MEILLGDIGLLIQTNPSNLWGLTVGARSDPMPMRIKSANTQGAKGAHRWG